MAKVTVEIPGVHEELTETKAEETEREKAKAAQEARARRYGISPKEGKPVTKPSEFAAVDDDDFGDPVNYAYPCDASRAKAALAYFNHEGQREAGGYTTAEWAVIGKRIAERISKHLEADYEYRDGKVVQKESKAASLPEHDSLAVKALREQDGGVVVGYHLLLWGSPNERDLQGDFFTPETELYLDFYKSVPTLFHHGLDESIGDPVIGHRLSATKDAIGLWVEAWLDKSRKYWAWIEPLLSAGKLYGSPGSAPHMVKRAEDGRLLRYPIVDDTLTPIPAQFRLMPVEQVKAAYKSANLVFAEPPGSVGDTGGAGASRRRRKVAELKSRLALLITE